MIGDRWDAVSQDAKDLVAQLLVVDPGSRLSAKNILKHEWFSEDGETVTQARKVMGLGLDMSEESDSGRGSMVACKAGKRKSDKSKEGKVFKRGCMAV